ncbi:D-3-phosphoglycerate dehydrogenase [Sporobacter termitidis DSM 10068]|uniref:D-3-phosphoglycerate dehydrogenase n=1 Tax=Sporobacter termitidis DSM 10068 TaxID=1123282 RepID=A0A1M5YFC9_9FIRM|nr:3-phosphoglycerate dehydrogenase family protein [Sporobacter termitidis]SHI10662.1 D-3-phosphoglycerate dehydrogenase [Sporobacter termitidis DSM 10068]
MYKVKTLNSIAPVGLDNLEKTKYIVSDEIDAPDAVLVRSANMLKYEFNPELLCIARAGAGTNNIPVDQCGEQGIVVFNTPGANAGAVKELVLCALLLSSRDIIGGIDWVRTIAEKGDEIGALVEKGKAAFVGPELFGKTLGVIGLGAVGAKIAHDAVALGMTVYGYDPYLSVEAAWRISSNVIHAKDIETIYKNCDYITIHVPYLESTHHLIDGCAMAMMKSGVRIINLARAELVCDDDIVEAIESGKVACYVTDFPNAKTARSPKVIAIPHLGASTPESEDNCAVMAAMEIVDYLENGNITNSVNMPSAVLPRTNDPRICVIHKNIPDMIAKITSAVSSLGINIENMVNASTKGRMQAYTIIDVQALAPGLEEKIKAVEGVIRVRSIC